MRCFMRITWLVLAFIMGALPATPAKKESPLLLHLQSEFLNKSFVAKILIGNEVVLNDQSGRECHRLIDTEFSPNVSTRYLARRGCYSSNGDLIGFLTDATFYADPHIMHVAAAPGARVRVNKIDLIDNRIEFWLASESNAYGKIKFMLGKGYQSWDYERVQGVIAQALRIESLELIATLTAEFSALKGKLQDAEAKYGNPSAPASEHLDSAKRLREVLQQLAQNRSAYASTGGAGADAGTYSKRATELDSEVARLEAEARTKKVDEVRALLQSNGAGVANARAVLEQPATNEADWQRKTQALGDYRRLLEERQKLHATIESYGQPVPAGDADSLKQGFDYAGAARVSLDREHQQIQLLQVDSEYRDMERRRVQLLDAYTKAFASAQERPTLMALIAHLEKMHANRVTAAQLGEPGAGAELLKWRSEIDKLKKR